MKEKEGEALRQREGENETGKNICPLSLLGTDGPAGRKQLSLRPPFWREYEKDQGQKREGGGERRKKDLFGGRRRGQRVPTDLRRKGDDEARKRKSAM
ncbi:hypothetical protein ABG768_005935 [Culter alburnus]|uniref:Uncharacterized protein n=1 Tax=Culter alburnus TaxID=194366 RepID=A0AAW1ZXD1_CULAL